MKRFISVFSKSAKELSDTRCIVLTGMFIAVYVLLDMLISIPIGEYMKISFSFLGLASVGMLFGPVPAAMAGAAGDILVFFLANKTGGGYIPGLTLVKIIEGLIYGLILYKAQVNKFFAVKCAASKFSVAVICNIYLRTLFLHISFGQAFWALMPGRILKNAVQFPVDAVLMTAVLPVVYTVYANVFVKRKEMIK